MQRLELSRFAAQVLNGRSLADKLVEAELLPDAQLPAALSTVPRWPARPAGLEPQDREGPPPRRVERDADRARLLQALANHELLALELMALVLLRFPDAPPGFRRGLAHTMQDEQRHLRLYLERLAAIGGELGQDPLSGYFWTALSDVSSPLDFVVRMSLTFEQANLDFARHYAARFREAGDAETAAVLDTVYRDEIAHVAQGLRWFRRWGDGRPDWERYCALLPAPLTPSRAKGPDFDADARRRAGFDEPFLRALRVFSASKGRPPKVFLFNPGCELEQADGRPGFRPPQAVARVAADLAPCLAWLAGRDDLVVVPRRPGEAWLAELSALGWALPAWLEATPETLAERLTDHTLGPLHPWGWSPRLHAALSPLAPQLSAAELPSADAVERLRALAAKPWAAEQAALLTRELGDDTDRRRLEVGAVHADADAVRAAVAAVWETGYPATLKAPWGSSGRGAIRVLGSGWTDEQLRWLDRTLEAQGRVVVEPWLDRLADLSLQLVVDADGPRELGLTRFLTDARGQYRGCVVGPSLRGLEPELLRALHGDGQLARLRAAGAWVGQALHTAGYRGPAGLDAFLYRHADQVRLRPLVEVNPRLTMGRVALALAKRLAPGREALWEQWRGPDLAGRAAALIAAEPPQVDDRGRLLAGAVCTQDPAQAQLALGVLRVSPSGS